MSSMRSAALSLPILLAASATAGAADPEFGEIVIDTDFFVEQPVLFGSLTDGEQHVVLAGRDDDHQQRLAIYRIDPHGGHEARSVLSLSPGTNLIAYDVGRLGNRDALFFIEPGRILRYDLAAGKLVEFADIRTIYGQNRAGEIVPLNFFRDVNQDDRDDLVVPDTAGYRVRLQDPDGNLGDETLLQDSSSMTVSGGIVSFESRPLFSGDMNADGLADLAVWRGNTLRVYPQLPGSRLQGQPQVVPLELDLLSEAEIHALQTNRGTVGRSGTVEKLIWSIEDLNNDRLPDILTESIFNDGVFDKRNEFRLHLGRRDGNRVAYREKEDALLASEGLQYGLISTDIDGDGKKDILVRKVQLTFGRVIRALLSGNVALQLHFFRMSDNDDYAEPANYIAKTTVRFSVSSGQVDIPAIKVADFGGDGLQDLMMQSGPDRLSIYPGVPGDSLFAREMFEMDIKLPRNGDLVAAEDINNDSRADLIIRYSAADGSELAHTVRLLLARPSDGSAP
ncbi:MAG: VCBS repeat-containing protein [Gammaproteobacteria bacterium]|nr:VCBS repeat-containing protein [Gammaproteobacteria bacterium]MDH3434256.1 VCBS repeat-containing protein [Gammaproteobacteria bacterium]